MLLPQRPLPILRMLCMYVCVCLKDRMHALKHAPFMPRGSSRLSPGAIRSERPAVPPHTAMQMKRNVLIKGQIPEMRGQKEEWGSKCLLGRWEVALESVLVVAGDHSLAPPQWRLIQGFCRSFRGALLADVIPVRLQRASLFIWGWPSRQVAAALWACQGEGTLLWRRGHQFLLPSQGPFSWEASQAKVNMRTILRWVSTHPDPMLPVGKKQEHLQIWKTYLLNSWCSELIDY